ncbi:hypothetical protein NE564_06185 [Blautia producta]|nr:hypothetical protein [Blautia producta]
MNQSEIIEKTDRFFCGSVHILFLSRKKLKNTTGGKKDKEFENFLRRNGKKSNNIFILKITGIWFNVFIAIPKQPAF